MPHRLILSEMTMRRAASVTSILIVITLLILFQLNYNKITTNNFLLNQYSIHDKCALSFSDIALPEKEVWVTVPGANLRSAFLDDRGGGRVVRLLAYFARVETSSYSCIYVSHCNITETAAARVEINGHTHVIPIFFECPPPTSSLADTLVSVLPNGLWPNATSLNNSLIPIAYRHNSNSTPNRTELVACISPIFDWSSTLKLFVFIEYYKRMGVNHFLIYKHSVDNETNKYLKELVKEGIATVILWNPMPDIKLTNGNMLSKTAELVHYNGQILSMNDCALNAYLRNARFALTVDIDEYLLPMSENATLLQLFSSLDSPAAGSIDIPSAFLLQNPANFTVMGNMSGVFPANVRSKQAIKPEAVYRQTVHQTWEYFSGFTPRRIDSNVALIYHFKEAANVTVSADSSLNRLRAVLQTILSDYHSIT